MKIKRYISLLLATVYLFAVGGQVYASLSCHCIQHRAHSCCSHCAEHKNPANDSGDPFLSAPCCDDNHSTEVALYTPAENSKFIQRIAVLDLPFALVPQLQVGCEVLHSAAEHGSEHRSPLPQSASRIVRGLRAPPVLA